MNVELFVIVAGLAVIAAVTVWLLKKWAAKPNEWASKIPPQPPEQEKKEPILPPEKPKQEPRRK